MHSHGNTAMGTQPVKLTYTKVPAERDLRRIVQARAFTVRLNVSVHRNLNKFLATKYPISLGIASLQALKSINFVVMLHLCIKGRCVTVV